MIPTGLTAPAPEYRVAVEQKFPATRDAVRLVRQWVAEHLTGLNPVLVADVQLAASELATNVWRHTLSRGDVFVAWLAVGVRDGADTCVQMSVTDRGRDLSLIDPERPGGWGLAIVREVTSEHGHINLDDGAHAAWFHISIPSKEHP